MQLFKSYCKLNRFDPSKLIKKLLLVTWVQFEHVHIESLKRSPKNRWRIQITKYLHSFPLPYSHNHRPFRIHQRYYSPNPYNYQNPLILIDLERINQLLSWIHACNLWHHLQMRYLTMLPFVRIWIFIQKITLPVYHQFIQITILDSKPHWKKKY